MKTTITLQKGRTVTLDSAAGLNATYAGMIGNNRFDLQTQYGTHPPVVCHFSFSTKGNNEVAIVDGKSNAITLFGIRDQTCEFSVRSVSPSEIQLERIQK